MYISECMIGKFIKSEIDAFFPLVKKVSNFLYINAILSLISDYHSSSIEYIYHAIKTTYLDFFFLQNVYNIELVLFNNCL